MCVQPSYVSVFLICLRVSAQSLAFCMCLTETHHVFLHETTALGTDKQSNLQLHFTFVTNYTGWSPREASSHSASQENFWFLWNPRVCCRVHNSQVLRYISQHRFTVFKVGSCLLLLSNAIAYSAHPQVKLKVKFSVLTGHEDPEGR